MTTNYKINNEIEQIPEDKNSSTEDDEKRSTRLIWLFVLNVCAVSMGHVILTVYTNGVIRTIERLFGLSSAKSGLLNSCNDIIHICLVIFIGYFGQRYNKPRIICFTIMFSAFAGVMMASPHILFSDYDDSYPHKQNFSTTDNDQMRFEATENEEQRATRSLTGEFTSTPGKVYSVFSTSSPNPNSLNHLNKEKYASDIQYCTNSGKASHDLENGYCEDIDQGKVHPAFYIFVIAQLISGIGTSAAFTLSMAYVDENAPKHKASIYIGVFLSLFSFAPAAGFMLATMCLKLPENLLSSNNSDSLNQPFIGCWWLGYLIGSIYIAVFATPLWRYPKQTSRKILYRELNADRANLIRSKKEEGFSQHLKDMPKAFVSLLSNKLFVINFCQKICGVYSIHAIFVNLVRYIEIHFNSTAAEGSIIAGAMSAVTGAVGNIVGGALVSRYKMRAIDGIRLVLFASFMFASGNLILMNLACPQVEMDMNYDPILEMNTVINDCNKHCHCTTNRMDYRPICATNNVSYFSPCVAGCTESVNGTFTDCKCLNIPKSENVTILGQYTEGTARPGYCIPPCNLLIPFCIIIAVMSFCSSLCGVSATMISFRIVKDEERSFALGINSFAANLLGFIPSPLIFGFLIDKSCTLWQVTCKTIGACLMFDVERLVIITSLLSITSLIEMSKTAVMHTPGNLYRVVPAWFRYSIFGSGFVIELINFSLNFAIFLFLRKMALGEAPLSRKEEETC